MSTRITSPERSAQTEGDASPRVAMLRQSGVPCAAATGQVHSDTSVPAFLTTSTSSPRMAAWATKPSTRTGWWPPLPSSGMTWISVATCLLEASRWSTRSRAASEKTETRSGESVAPAGGTSFSECSSTCPAVARSRATNGWFSLLSATTAVRESAAHAESPGGIQWKAFRLVASSNTSTKALFTNTALPESTELSSPP